MIIDGRKIAKEIIETLKTEVASLSEQPKLVDIVVGENSVTESYVGIKQRRAEEVGIEFIIERFPENVTEKDLLYRVLEIQKDPNLAGLLIQLPLPDQINKNTLLNAIELRFDVDGLTDQNTKMLYAGSPQFIPATAGAIMELINSCELTQDLNGMPVAVIGSGDLVGKPVAFMLKQRGAEVTVVNRSTSNINEICKRSKLIVSGAGSPGLLTSEMVSEGVVVIDAGTAESDGGITGDVDFDSVSLKASYITPVPGGVGPVTVAMLLKNTVQSAKARSTKI